ncbi:hypothetical protein ACOSQ3_006760 [Xanthoceras sorbifolium]
MVIFVKPISQATISFLLNKSLTSKKGASNSQLKLGKIVRIWSGMVLCIIFCVVWAQQYCLVGLLQGSGIKGLEEFMIGELPKSLKNYALAMNGFVIDGIGNFLGICSPQKSLGDTGHYNLQRENTRDPQDVWDTGVVPAKVTPTVKLASANKYVMLVDRDE